MRDPANGDRAAHEYTASVGVAHRRRHGQFFTPPAVARFMTRWVLDGGSSSLFDPAFGLGAFRDALPNTANIAFRASEIDAGIVQHWRRAQREAGDFIAIEDYLLSWGRRHANIVCNPPYMRFQKFGNRHAVFRAFEKNLGLRLSGYTNTASAFLCKSLAELGPAGRMAYIMPLEFLGTGYGAVVKARLLESGHLFGLVRLNCEKALFPDATTSAGIVLCDTRTRHRAVRFHDVHNVCELDDFSALRPRATVPVRHLDPNAKWLPHFRAKRWRTTPAASTTLRAYGKFTRGIATGANAFFVLRPSTARELGLNPATDCVPCIARSVQISLPVFDDADHEALRARDQPALLFSVAAAVSTGAACSRQAADYIRSGEQAGFHKRFLTRKRNPWHKTEARTPARLLLGVFARGEYKVVLNTSRALHLTCFHGFAPNAAGGEFVDRLFLFFASRTGRRIASLAQREYGNALRKFEPNDLSDAPVPTPSLFATLHPADVAGAVAHMRETGTVPQWVDDRFAPLLRENKPPKPSSA